MPSAKDVPKFRVRTLFCRSKLTALPKIKSGNAKLKAWAKKQNKPKRIVNQLINRRPQLLLVFTVRSYSWLIDRISVLVRFANSRMLSVSRFHSWFLVWLWDLAQQNKILIWNCGKCFADGTTQHSKKPQQQRYLHPLLHSVPQTRPSDWYVSPQWESGAQLTNKPIEIHAMATLPAPQYGLSLSVHREDPPKTQKRKGPLEFRDTVDFWNTKVASYYIVYQWY